MTTATDTKPTVDVKARDALLMRWTAAKAALEAAKETEMDLRKECMALAFPDAEEGVNTAELGNGYELKGTRKINYKLLDNDIVEKALDDIRAIGNEGSFIADRLVSWTPTLSLSEYRELEPHYKAIIDKAIETNDGAPTLVIKEPKKKK